MFYVINGDVKHDLDQESPITRSFGREVQNPVSATSSRRVEVCECPFSRTRQYRSYDCYGSVQVIRRQ